MMFKSLLGFASIAAASPMDLDRYLQAFEARDGSTRVTNTNLDNMKFYTQHAAAAYCNYNTPPGQKIECRGDACPLVAKNQPIVIMSMVGKYTGIGAYVSTDNLRNETVLAVRGSNNIRNWITDFIFSFQNCDLTNDCKVHTGFATAWSEIADEATKAINSARKAHPNYKVILTGHSLGGAVATLGAAYLRKAGIPLDLYTYGSPRVGNDKFTTWFSSQKGGQWRVTHESDPVPRLPPMGVGYRHVTPEYWLTGGDAWKIDYTVDQIRVCHGIANAECNAKLVLPDIFAHLRYLGITSGCSKILIGARDTSQPDDLPQDVKDRLEYWAQTDREFVKEHGL